ncbi:MAG TPA: hypothetical protein VHG28_24665 [Longimicrobiaceae bacterium]|nr:hypothetical protein [Longimicrobiaceae bacterium]
MKMHRLWLLVGIPLALAACGQNDTEAEEDQPAEGAADTATQTVAPAPAPADTSAAAHGTMGGSGFALNPVGGSGVSGQATVADQGGQTGVTVQLTGFQPNSRHAGHIHTGTCENPGPPVAPLPEITADANGAGNATGTASLPMTTAMDGQHIVSYHQGGADSPGPPVVCGAIPGHSM